MNDPDDPDDDFLPSAQVSYYGAQGWTPLTNGATIQMSQNQSSTQRSRNHGASSSQRDQGPTTQSGRVPTSQRPSNNQGSRNQAPASQRSQNPGASTQRPQSETPTNSDRHIQLEHLTQGMNFLKEQLESLARSEKGSVKNEDKKKKQKEGLKCQICHRVLANKTNLFRHYKSIHNEFHPDERFGYTTNDTVLSLDDSVTQELRCGICGYVSVHKNAMDAHTYLVHSNDVNKCRVCGYKARSKDDFHSHSRTHVNNNNGSANNNDSANNNGSINVSNNVVEAVKDKMHKCEECDCYFVDKNKFDEHMKVMHGFEVLCKICNKNFRFKDFEGHVRDAHPDVYKDKETVDNKGNVIDEKNVRTKSGRVIVFKCNKCNEKFSSKKEAWRHAKIHKKEFRTRAVTDPQTNSQSDVNKKDVQTDSDILFVCEACNIASDSYDVVVEHSQKHIANPDIQFATIDCNNCKLKFEPICYEKHIVTHYKNKGTNKESFKYMKYKHHLLLTKEWFNFFNMEKEVVDRMISRSIYVETRSIKMRVVSGNLPFTNTLYECRQCDNFIEPPAVTNHALNFDTCVRIKHSFTCNVCERSFNTQIACDNHETVHTGDESFRIVMFNDEMDREFNYKLNNAKPSVKNQVATSNDEENTDAEKVLYKCLCGLCFVVEDSANNHLKTCPGSDQKQVCQKCNNLFNLHELVVHCYEHHMNENIRVITKNIVPDAVVISDDESQNAEEEAIEIPSSDDEDDNSDKVKQPSNSENPVQGDKENEPRTSGTQNVIQNDVSTEESETQTDLVASTDNARDVPMDVDNGENNELTSDESTDHPNSKESDHEDSQNTIISDENYTNPNTRDVTRNEIKCVETNLLINPFFVRNRGDKNIEADERNNNLSTEMETARLKMEAPEVHIKEEIPWHVTDMNGRFVRQTSNVTSTGTVFIDLGEILTDDEDEEMTPLSVHAVANDETSNVSDINENPEYIQDIEAAVPYNIQNVNNGIISNSNISANVIEESDIHSEDTMDIYLPNQANCISVDGNNAIFKQVAVLSENQTIINTDFIKIEDETKVKRKLLTQSRQNENAVRNTEIEEITPNYNMPTRNRVNDTEKRIVVNNLEIQLSGQPNCSIF